MSNTGKKTTFNHKLVKITWWDIKSSEKSWIAEDEVMKEDIAICYDVGWIWKQTKDKLWLFTSYSFDFQFILYQKETLKMICYYLKIQLIL
jgi:hypothetical protein